MIRKYIIDGNNLIGKINELWVLQQKDKQLSRIKLVKIIDQYFREKKYKVSIHFDGYAGPKIPSSFCSIHYSNDRSADSRIKHEIDGERNPKTLVIVSSDHSVQNYSKVNSCTIIKSEEFARLLQKGKKRDSEEDITKTISNDEIKKLFGL